MPRDELPTRPQIVASDCDVTLLLHRDLQNALWWIELTAAILAVVALLAAWSLGWLP